MDKEFVGIVKGFVDEEELDKILWVVDMVIAKPEWLRGGKNESNGF